MNVLKSQGIYKHSQLHPMTCILRTQSSALYQKVHLSHSIFADDMYSFINTVL